MIVTVTLNPSLDEWVYLPRLRLGELNRAECAIRYPGGKGINVSRVVHELGGKTLAVALAGGSDGAVLGHLLARQGIAHRFVRIEGATRNNYHIHATRPRALTQINTPGPRVSRRALATIERLVGRLSAGAACVVLSGSLPPGLPTTTYQRLMARDCRPLTVLDTSGPALRAGLAAAPWLIKPNRQEAEELVGHALRRLADVATAARALTRRGPRLVLISLGARGAVLASQTHAAVLWAAPPAVQVDSAVGAGDSLVAGFVLGWRRTHSLREALRLGVACGAACAMTPGTELCHRSDVLRLKGRVTLRTL